jgi:putative transposase
MSEHIFKRHNKSLLLYHLVCLIKYRRNVLTDSVELSLVSICENISERYEIHFVEIEADENYVHFLIQSVLKISVEIIVRTVKSIIAKEIFRLHPEVKNKLWGGNLWTSGYYVNTVGQYGNEDVIRKYIQNQGEEKTVCKAFNTKQLRLSFE